MSFKKYLAVSALIHLFLTVALIILPASKTRIKPLIPKKWFLDASLVLSEEKGIAVSKETAKIIPDSMPSVIEKINSSPKKDITPRNASDAAGLTESKTVKAENPAEEYTQSLRKSFMSRVNNQFLLIKTKAFFRSMRARLNALLNEAFTAGIDPSRESALTAFDGNSCLVTITYDESGKLAALSILPAKDSVSPRAKEFASALKEKILWQSIPLPSDFALPYKGLNLTISVSSTKFLIDIEPF